MELRKACLLSSLLLLIFVANVARADGKKHGKGRLVGKNALRALVRTNTIPRLPTAIFDVKSFGAVGDGQSDDSQVIKQAQVKLLLYVHMTFFPFFFLIFFLKIFFFFFIL